MSQAFRERNLSRLQIFLTQWWIPLLMAVVLISVVNINMLLFHTLVELFAVAIAVVSFIVAWNTFHLARNGYLVMLGCGYLVIRWQVWCMCAVILPKRNWHSSNLLR